MASDSNNYQTRCCLHRECKSRIKALFLLFRMAFESQEHIYKLGNRRRYSWKGFELNKHKFEHAKSLVFDSRIHWFWGGLFKGSYQDRMKTSNFKHEITNVWRQNKRRKCKKQGWHVCRCFLWISSALIDASSLTCETGALLTLMALKNLNWQNHCYLAIYLFT